MCLCVCVCVCVYVCVRKYRHTHTHTHTQAHTHTPHIHTHILIPHTSPIYDRPNTTSLLRWPPLTVPPFRGVAPQHNGCKNLHSGNASTRLWFPLFSIHNLMIHLSMSIIRPCHAFRHGPTLRARRKQDRKCVSIFTHKHTSTHAHTHTYTHTY